MWHVLISKPSSGGVARVPFDLSRLLFDLSSVYCSRRVTVWRNQKMGGGGSVARGAIHGAYDNIPYRSHEIIVVAA